MEFDIQISNDDEARVLFGRHDENLKNIENNKDKNYMICMD